MAPNCAHSLHWTGFWYLSQANRGQRERFCRHCPHRSASLKMKALVQPWSHAWGLIICLAQFLYSWELAFEFREDKRIIVWDFVVVTVSVVIQHRLVLCNVLEFVRTEVVLTDIIFVTLSRKLPQKYFNIQRSAVHAGCHKQLYDDEWSRTYRERVQDSHHWLRSCTWCWSREYSVIHATMSPPLRVV